MKKLNLYNSQTIPLWFLQNTESALQCFDVLNSFERLSGLKVNAHKSEAIWIGANKGKIEKPLPVKWPEHIKVLGIYFGHNKKKVE